VIRGLWFFLQLALLVVAAVWLAEQPGSASVEFRGWLLETSAGMLVLILVLLALLLLALWRLWRSVAGAPHLIGRVRRRRRHARGQVALVRSLSAMAAGEGAVALRHAGEAAAIGEPALAHLATAEAAELAGDPILAEAEYERLRARPDTALIGLRGLIGLKAAAGDRTGAIDLARQARKLAPKSPWLARRLFELEVADGRLVDAERSLADAAKLGALAPEEADRALATLLLSRARAEEKAGREAEALSDAERAHGLDPASAAPALFAARLLGRAGRVPAAERILTRSWAASPDPALAAAWLGLAPPDPASRLRQAERLHALDRGAALGRLVLGEALLTAGRWADARAALTAIPGAETRHRCRLMAYLESASGNPDKARAWFEASLSAPEDAVPARLPDEGRIGAAG
jgi:HemY protein